MSFCKDYSKSPHISGNIMLALFAAIGAVGVIGATGMTVLKGPVRSMHNVTQKTIAENNIIASSKLAVMAAANQANGGDCDGDNTVEPVAWSVTGTGPKPTGGGYLPANIGASMQDPWGNTYGYCVWDHGAAIQTTCPTPTQRLRGAGVGGSGPVIAIISSGADRTFQTSCANAPTYVQKVSGSDDIVLSYTYAEATAASGGLWNLQEDDLNTAEIQKNLEVKNADGDTTFELDRTTGIGDFIGIRTGSIAAKGVEPVTMAGGLKVDNDTNVTQCSLPQHRGILRYHMSEGLQVCDGTQWASAGGGAVPTGTIAAFASNTCPSGWSEYSPARGRFLRGRDPSGTNDVVRNAGSVQADSNRSHSHTGTAASGGAHTHTGTAASAGSHTHSGSTSTAGEHTHTLSGRGDNNAHYIYGAQLSAANNVTTSGAINAAGAHAHTMNLNAAGEHTHTVSINSGGTHTHALTIDADGGTEARPKNVAVTFCVYDGGVPVTEIAGLDNLSDVVLSSPQVGQVLTYDGANWINGSMLSSQWTTSGSNIYYNIGNVGIGADSPQAKLHVKSAGTEMTNAYGKTAIFEAGHPVIQFKGTSGNRSGFIGYDSQTSSHNPEAMRFWVGAAGDDHGGSSAAAMTIKANGNVGIANSMPNAQLDILGKDSVTPINIDRPFHGPVIVMRNIAGPNSVNSYPNVTDKWEIYPNGVSAGSTASRLSFVTRTPAEVPTTQMSINNSGTLQVTGGIGFGGGRGGMGYYNVSPYDQVELGVSSSFPSTSLSFFTNSVSRMNINPSGLVGIGTVSPQELLHVAGGARIDGHLKGGSSSNFHIDAQTTSMGVYLNYYSTGNVFARNTLLASSDIRLKKDIVPIDSSLDKINAMQGVYFNWKDPQRPGKQVGLIAQEVEKIFPELVREDEEGFKTVSYSALVAPLINAVKELKSMVDDIYSQIKEFSKRMDDQDVQIEILQKENEALRARLDALEKKKPEAVTP